MPFEISQLATSESADLHILDGDGEPTGIVITLASPHSAKATAIAAKNQAALTRYAAKHRLTNMSVAQSEAYTEFGKVLEDKRLVALTEAWRDGDEPKLLCQGKKLECTPENILIIYGVPAIRSQVQKFLEDEGNFTRG